MMAFSTLASSCLPSLNIQPNACLAYAIAASGRFSLNFFINFFTDFVEISDASSSASLNLAETILKSFPSFTSSLNKTNSSSSSIPISASDVLLF